MPKVNPAESRVTYVLNEEYVRLKLAVKPGQVLEAKVLNRLDEFHYLLSIRNQKVIAELKADLPTDKHILLQVNKIARKLSLKLLGIAEEASKKLLHTLSFKYGNDVQQRILIQKMIQYQIPFDQINMNIISQIYGFILQQDPALVLYSPEFWLLLKRWKILPEEKNLNLLLSIFRPHTMNDVFSLIDDLSKGGKPKTNVPLNYKMFIYEQLIGTQPANQIKNIAELIQNRTVLSWFRFEIANFMETGSGLLPVWIAEKKMIPVFVKRASMNPHSKDFHFMLFFLVEGDALVVDSLWRKDYIQIEFLAQTQKLLELIRKFLPQFKLPENFTEKLLVKNKLDIDVAQRFFKQLLPERQSLERTL